MRRHWAYLKYVLIHKWYVALACWKYGVPLWRAVIHDWHKFLPSEWLPYARTFYAPDGSRQYIIDNAFAHAWNLHQKRAKHHWQFWLLTLDMGKTIALPMPETYVREMVADWSGAGMAINGQSDPSEWFLKQVDKMRLDPSTEAMVRKLLFPVPGDVKPEFLQPTFK